jgi:hypothetical protein
MSARRSNTSVAGTALRCWQRKTARSVEDFLSSEPVRHLLHGVDAARSS